MPRDLTDSHQTGPGEPPSSDTPLKRLDSFDLFNNLLFNREIVYQTFRRVSPIGTVALKEDILGEEERMKSKDQTLVPAGSVEEEAAMPLKFRSLLFYLNQPAAEASDSGEHPRRTKHPRRTTRDETQPETGLKRRKLGGSSNERATKICKSLPKANTSKRVNGRGATLLDAIIVSDDDDNTREPRRHFSTSSLTPIRQIKSDRPSSEEDLRPSQFPTPKPTYSMTSDFELSHLKAAHAKELADLQHQLNTSEIRARQITAEAGQAATASQRRQLAESSTRIANLEEELENERNRSYDFSRECEHLCQQMEDARASLESEAELKQQRDTYERLHKEQQDTTADLRRERAEQQDLSQRKEQELTEQIASLNEQLEVLWRELSQLRDDNATLKDDNAKLQEDIAALQDDNAALQDDDTTLQDDDSSSFQDENTTLQSVQSTASSAASTASASTSTSDLDQTPDYEQRLANMRKTYVAIKKKHDMLSSVAASLASATRGWDYGNFGQFGGCLRQLGAVLGGEAGEKGEGE